MSNRQEDLRTYRLQLDQVNDGLSLSPDDAELLSLKEQLTQLIDLLKEELKVEEAGREAKTHKWQQKAKPPTQPQPTNSSTTPSSPAPEVSSPDRSSTPKQGPYKVGDIVSAKWLSGDGAFYAAKVTQVTGLSTKPNYTVKFLKWEDSPMETLPHYHVTDLKEHQKRKVTAVEKPPPPKKIDLQAREAAEEKKRRRLREKQELERTKQNWQSFAAKGPKKRSGAVGRASPIGSNSMFKTPESHGGRGMFSSHSRTAC